MKRKRAVLLGATCVGVTITLTSCTPATPLAYHVTNDSIDIAFCDGFSATSMEIDFGKYPPPFLGSLYSIALQSAAGPEVWFGDGAPISESTSDWTLTSESDAIPEDWERIDFSFYDASGEFVGGEYLFRRDVKSSDWAWIEGRYVTDPQCQLDLD
jgi:hypothetical protein